MDVILLERIDKLGQMGDVVKVRAGYARNFLLPQRKALRATKENMAVFERQRVHLEAINLKRKEEAQAIADRMSGLALLVVRQASETGQLYGSVTARDLRESIKDAGFTVDRSQVELDRPIKSLGRYEVMVALHPEVKVAVQVQIARSEAEAEALAAGEAELDAMAGESEAYEDGDAPEGAQDEAVERPLDPSEAPQPDVP